MPFSSYLSFLSFLISSAGHKAEQVWRRHDHSGLVKNALQFVVCIFLDSLRVLKFLN